MARRAGLWDVRDRCKVRQMAGDVRERVAGCRQGGCCELLYRQV